MTNKETDKCVDCEIDKFIRNNYRPIDNKPGYVWFSYRNRRIIKLDVLKRSICSYMCGQKEEEKE